MPSADYFKMPGENWSKIKHVLTSPAHYKAELAKERKTTDAMRIGTAAHTLILEPHLWDEQIRMAPTALMTGSGTLSSGKEARAWLATVPVDCTVLTDDEAERVRGMAQAVADHEAAQEVLRLCKTRELSFTWQSMGKHRKGSADALGSGILCDLKTDGEWGETTTPFSFVNKADRLHYFGQFGYYQEGLAENGHQIDEMIWTVVGSKAPFNVLVISLDKDGMAHARDEAYEAMRRMVECETSGKWPGTHPRKVRVGAPKWCGWKGQEMPSFDDEQEEF